MPRPERVIAYTRVSTTSQAAEGISLDAQRARIEAWCGTHGATLAEGDLYVDAGLSGKRADNRPALQAALDAVCHARGVLVVYSLSRLARSTRDTLTIAERLDSAGAGLVSLSEQIDTTTAAGTMFFRLMAVMAEFERDLISERTRTALAHKRGRSERTGQIPYGWSLAGDGRTLVPDADERRTLDVIARLRSDGLSLRAIAAEITRRGIAPKNQNQGRPWSHSTIADLLRSHASHERPQDDTAGHQDPRPACPEPSTA